MHKKIRLAVVAGVMAAAAGAAIVAEAQTNVAQTVQARKDVMRGNGRALASIQPMLRNEQPWNAQTAAAAMTSVRDGMRSLPSLFPAGSGAQAGIETRALPAIWDQRAAFEAQVASIVTAADQLVTLAQAGNEAGFRAGMGAVTQVCGSCHTTFRAPQ